MLLKGGHRALAGSKGDRGGRPTGEEANKRARRDVAREGQEGFELFWARMFGNIGLDSRSLGLVTASFPRSARGRSPAGRGVGDRRDRQRESGEKMASRKANHTVPYLISSLYVYSIYKQCTKIYARPRINTQTRGTTNYQKPMYILYRLTACEIQIACTVGKGCGCGQGDRAARAHNC